MDEETSSLRSGIALKLREQGCTLEQIGEILSICRERARQLVKLAESKKNDAESAAKHGT
jgi:DNA-directed RNA polymerase sigma subunit (sigma70/sigma32)